MPLSPTPNGFNVTYDRVKCAVAGLGAFIFAGLMIAVGIDAYIPVLDGTVLEDFIITRRPVWLLAGIMIIGGIVLSVVAAWNGRNAFARAAAMIFDAEGVDARSLIGRRIIKWQDVGAVDVINGTVFLTPSPGSMAKPTPLQTFLTSVKPDELTRTMAQHRPELFGAVEETRM